MYSFVSGPINYRKINFTYHDRHSLHLFGDNHGFTTECKENSIPLPLFIQHTIEEHPNLDLDIIIESSKPHKNFSLSNDLMGYTEDHFNQYGCFMDPIHERCARQFPRARFHHVDVRGDLIKDYIFVVNKLNSFYRFNGTRDTWKDNMVECILSLRANTDNLVALLRQHASILTSREKLLWISDILESRVIRVIRNHYFVPQYFNSLALISNVPLQHNIVLAPTIDFNIDLYYYCIFHKNAPRYMKTVLGIQYCEEALQTQLVRIITTFDKKIYNDWNMISASTLFCAMLMDVSILALICTKPCRHVILVAGNDHCTRLVNYIQSNPLFSNSMTSSEFKHPEMGQCVSIPSITFSDDMPVLLPEFPIVKPTRNPVYHLTKRESLGKKKKRTRTRR
jgi:hypothetical protein